ncbi:MAG TPA: porin family protein [Flavisolibacter sp.]
MKKISLFVLALSVGTALVAQELRTPMAVKTRFGLKGGLNVAYFNVSDYPAGGSPEAEQKKSINGGFLVNIPIGGMFAIQPEVMYSEQGSKMAQTTTIGTVTTTQAWEQDLKYINVPVMLQVKSPGGFFVEAGPQAGYLVSGKQIGPSNGETENEDKFRKWDFSLGAGLGYLSRIGLGLNARYNHGFSNVWDEDANMGNAELNNRVIQVGLVYHFGAHK